MRLSLLMLLTDAVAAVADVAAAAADAAFAARNPRGHGSMSRGCPPLQAAAQDAGKNLDA